MVVVLVGFMGAGKTTVGHIMAERLGQPVHGQLVRAVGGQHLAGGGQQEPPVARGVGAFGGFGSPGHLFPGHLFPRHRGLVHGIHSTAGILNGVKSV